MDLHRGLNALLERLAGETIDGAQAYMLGDGDGDRELVRAFMRCSSSCAWAWLSSTCGAIFIC